jgi:hypothetical protein
MNTSEILTTAADLIESHGWHAGPLPDDPSGWGNRSDGFSIVGAVYNADGCHPDAHEAFTVLDGLIEAPQDWYLAPSTSWKRFDCGAWEEIPGRTRAEVVSKLREAAAKVQA